MAGESDVGPVDETEQDPGRMPAGPYPLMLPRLGAELSRRGVLDMITASKADLAARIRAHEYWRERVLQQYSQSLASGASLCLAVNTYLNKRPRQHSSCQSGDVKRAFVFQPGSISLRPKRAGGPDDDVARLPLATPGRRDTCLFKEKEDVLLHADSLPYSLRVDVKLRAARVALHVMYFRLAGCLDRAANGPVIAKAGLLAVIASLSFFALWMAYGGAEWLGLFLGSLALAAATLIIQSQVFVPLPKQVELLHRRWVHRMLSSAVTELVTSNSDSVLGKTGKWNHVAGYSPVPEAEIRRLDDELRVKEAINSFESTIRARIRNVDDTLRSVEESRHESFERLKSGALGITASFLVFEVGERIQTQRDLNAGHGQKAFKAWMSMGGSEGTSAHPGTGGTQGGVAAIPALGCPAFDAGSVVPITEIPHTDACLQAWLDADRQSSLELVLVTIVISIIIVVLRTFRPTKAGPTPGG